MFLGIVNWLSQMDKRLLLKRNSIIYLYFYGLMLKRYLPIFKNHLFLLAVIIALVIISSRTKGKTAVVTSTIAGIVMIYAAITFIVWLIKTPAKKDKDSGL